MQQMFDVNALLYVVTSNRTTLRAYSSVKLVLYNFSAPYMYKRSVQGTGGELLL